jgi:hypothetical protein
VGPRDMLPRDDDLKPHWHEVDVMQSHSLMPHVEALGWLLHHIADTVDLDLQAIEDASSLGAATKVSDFVLDRSGQEDSSASRVR